MNEKRKTKRSHVRKQFKRRKSITPMEQQLSFFSAPLQVIAYSGLYLLDNGKWAVEYLWRYPNALIYSTAALSLYASLHLVEGSHIKYILSADALVVWYTYWVFLGILSSIGLGAGLHTFVLFLGPHIARVTLTAYECESLDFDVYGTNAFNCPNKSTGNVRFFKVLLKVLLESLCWGAGTAIGELPPYFMAKAASTSGQKIPQIEELKERGQLGTSIKDKILANLNTLLEKYGFLGIFLFASIPNPLFDLAGITCGHFQVPFWTFFGATFLGKSFIKATIQSIIVITAFSKDTIEAILGYLKIWSTQLHDLAENVLIRQVNLFGDSEGDAMMQPSRSSIIGVIWNGLISLMLIYFAITMLESFASTYHSNISQARKSGKTLQGDQTNIGHKRQHIA
ncbi:hypothetical protein H4219_000685 [Mycoemilia scoparia]|uniref:VTT domain-containing protein n=1 Tax=Mycoemilia scoparia TaxID=417184 RepID=A0A9W8AA67_9FUNG|nr:hypothetical protein H4219_000685 [Mycoemilia scoparia]